MKNMRKLKLAGVVTGVMLACCACTVSSNTNMSMNKDGKGVYKTKVMFEKEYVDECGKFIGREGEKISDILKKHPVQGVNMKIKDVQDKDKTGVEISVAYNNTKEFNDIMKQIDKFDDEDIIVDNDKLETDETSAVDREYEEKYLKDKDFIYKVDTLLTKNDIKFDKNSNQYKQLIKVLKDSLQAKFEEELKERYNSTTE